ncbi:MAG: L-isoaspartyl protein carboxyl methyltransferase, protein-L-isoaspartate(D-aspartate) O-methyltransferase [Parcubacteria group bacterium GW2011_GWC1_38_6]|nr:MAG: Protein-L-isoaspartate(D-aspartate) O-methyltransferase [Parcubacteria group bacterium GW2011_GWA1_36_12]KKQ77099.1 MAG: L-isoaspartyl protein carboxyl methyltransferase, protein-L-isoaspartate(D-aspartate) O-methyltransferase [Parcubacteria group bacterium GW2011_GWC1_38_6]
MELIDSLVQSNWLKTSTIIDAFRKIERKDFLLEDSKNLAEIDEALSIGYGQTISQPLVVAFMLELLQPREGESIMDIGFGSGWTTALLSEIVGSKGKVISIEIVPKLAEFGRKNITKYGFIEKGIAECYCRDATDGYPELKTGFDRILASASIQEEDGKSIDSVPIAWKQQLKVGGRIVTPINDSIWLFEKMAQDKFKEKEYHGFTFVPLISK